jgi:hypothetical protein
MKLKDVVLNANNIPVNEEFLTKVESVYSCELPEIMKHILSIDPNVAYDDRDDLFKLENNMILEASKEMNSDFVGHNLLPIFDRFDNDYICYDYANNVWCMFNTVDDLTFNKQKNFSDLF